MRSRRAVALVAPFVLATIPVLVMACAVSDATEAPDAQDKEVVIPGGDSGDATSFDADDPSIPCEAGNLCRVGTPLDLGAISSMTGRSKGDVWACATGGLFLHWDGTRWGAIDSNLNETFSTIFLTPDEIWAASGTLVIRRRADAESFRTLRIAMFGQPVAGLAILSSVDPYLVLAPSWLHVNRATLTKLNFETKELAHEPPPIQLLTNEPTVVGARATFLLPGKILWVVGDRAAVVRYPLSPREAGDDAGDAGREPEDGGAAVPGQGIVLPVESQANLFAAWAYDEQLWAAGSRGTILHFDGRAWGVENTGTTATLNAVFGISPNDIWAAGDDGTVLHFDGTSWSRVPVPVAGYVGGLRTIWGSASDDVWIGGDNVMLHWGGLP